MGYEQRDNSGTIFKNDKREKDTHPHGTGKAMIGGVMYYVSAWTKDGNNGKFQSLSFKPVEQQAPTQTRSNQRPEPASGSFDDEIPFSDPLRGRAALTV